MRIYHVVPKHMYGDELHPLRVLEVMQPGIHAIEVQKYADRKELLQVPLPVLGLDCFWTNVVFFTPIHPAELRRGWKEGGVEVPKPLAFFEVEADSLNHSKLAIYPNEAVKVEKIFFPFTIQRARMYRRVRNRAVDHFKSERALGRSPNWFTLIPQIVYRGSVKVDFKSVVHA